MLSFLRQKLSTQQADAAAPAFCAASKPQKAGAAARPSCLGRESCQSLGAFIVSAKQSLSTNPQNLGSAEEVQAKATMALT